MTAAYVTGVWVNMCVYKIFTHIMQAHDFKPVNLSGPLFLHA